MSDATGTTTTNYTFKTLAGDHALNRAKEIL